MERFYCENLFERKVGEIVGLSRQDENHLFKVLRGRVGEHIGLLDGHGRIGKGIVEEGRMVRLECLEQIDFQGRRIHLYLASPRRQKMDAILKAVTELGVYRIVPMICQYSVAIPDGESKGRQEELMIEGCKQSGNPYLPILDMPMKFPEAIADAKKNCGKIFYGSPYQNLDDGEEVCSDVGFFVGPEGGFSPAEEQSLIHFGGVPLRIGNWILRVETAAIAGVAKLL